MFQVFLITSYTILFSIFILKTKFFRRFEIPVVFIVTVFVIKVLVGLFYWFVHKEKYGGGDTWGMFNQANSQVYYSLFKNPVLFLKLVFLPCTFPPPSGLEHYSQSIGAYGNESYYFIVRFHSLVRLISFGYYNVHVVFYNFFSLIGILYFVKFLRFYIKGKDELILISLCLFPGVAFWTSGMHKDGFGLAALGIFMYSLVSLLRKNYSILNFVALILSLMLLSILRGFILVILVPLVLSFCWTFISEKKVWLKFLVVHAVYFLLVFNLHWIFPEINLLNRLVFVQQEFFNLIVTPTTIPLTTLKPTFASLISIVPEGIAHCIFRPYLWEISSPIQLISSIENIVLIILTIVVFVFFREKKSYSNPFVLFSLLYIILLYSLIGILVPNLGALVRYKCTGVLFWLLLLIYSLDWNKVKKVLQRTNT